MKSQHQQTSARGYFTSRGIIFGYLITLSMSIAGYSCRKDISCDECSEGNTLPGAVAGSGPVANAGPDQIIGDSTVLDASGSTDPNNNITEYEWKKISGPDSYLIKNPKAVRTEVTKLSKGVYLFTLKVTGKEGLFSLDTVQVTSNSEGVSQACDITSRPLINAQLLSLTSLPAGSGREYVAYGNKLYVMTLECPTCIGPTKKRAYYNIFDLNTKTWSKSSEFLITPREHGATLIAASNRIFYVGGSQSDPPDHFAVIPDVDIYDITSNTWSSTALSAGGTEIAGAVINNKVLFAGGLRADEIKLAKPSPIVDIYDLSSNSWSIASLGEARADISAVTANGKVYFAGGSAGINAINGFLGASRHVDIYDEATATWSVSLLAAERTKMAGIPVGNKIFWAGGLGDMEGWRGDVEVRDINTASSMQTCLNQQKYWDHNRPGAAFKGNDQIVFFTGIPVSDFTYNTRFDIYNAATESWSVGLLPIEIGGASVFSSNGDVYVVGGFVNGKPSNHVFQLLF